LEDDFFEVLFFSAAALASWVPWYADVLRLNRLGSPPRARLLIALAPLACLVLLFVSLDRFAAKDVRESGPYIVFYLMMGAAALGISSQLFALLGLSARDDVLERRNNAALIALLAAQLGVTFCFAGGNIGEGPGPETVVISAGTAIAVWFAFWRLAEFVSGAWISEGITVDRDLARGVRLAGLLIANGVILGSAAAGDWIANRFLHDFALSAWPALVFSVAVAVLERMSTPYSSVRNALVTASSFVLAAIAFVFFWDMGP